MLNAELTLINTTVAHTKAISDATAAGGGVSMTNNGHLALIDSSIHQASAVGRLPVEGGGGIFVQGNDIATEVVIANTTISECTTSNVGGGLAVAGGSVLMTNGSLLTSNYASIAGQNFIASGGTTLYQLPAPLGHWIAGAECRTFRQACPLNDYNVPKDANCAPTRLECSRLADIKNASSGDDYPPRVEYQGITVECQPALAIQPCNWKNNVNLLGKVVQVLPRALRCPPLSHSDCVAPRQRCGRHHPTGAAAGRHR